MRVTFLLSSPRGFFGGIETIADNLARALVARGHDLALVSGAPRPLVAALLRPDRIAVLPPLPVSSPAARWAARLLRASPLNVQSLSFFLRWRASRRARHLVERADAVVTFFEGEAVLFSRFLRPRGLATVYYYHGGVDARWAVRDRSTRRVAISHTIAAHGAQRHAYPCHGVVWPGIAAELLSRPCAADYACGPERLVYTGRLERHPKRPDWLLDCFAALAPEFPRLTLRLVGDGPMRARLEEQAGRLGVADRLVLTGAQSPAGVRAELQHADLFLFPSTYESFGVSVLEAMAAGVPVIASDLPALREATGGQAILLPIDDRPAWIEAARRLLGDSAARRERSEAGRLWASRFTWGRAAQRLERYLIAAHNEARGAIPTAAP